jgi:hypothetical protein
MSLAVTGTGEYADEERTASTFTYANDAPKRDTRAISARERALLEVLDSRILRPRWVRHLMWNDLDLGISRAALWTENAVPLPQVPPEEFNNKEAMNTIADNPHLLISPVSKSYLLPILPNLL